jgi:RimJ/RimL family protein N-acetyltransferase
VLDVFAGLGRRSRELRFLTGARPALSPTELQHLTDVDHHRHAALVAESPDGRAVGIARFCRDPEDDSSAEVAIAVVDTWQGRGVGRRLASALAARARQVGVRRFTMEMRSDNEAALQLLLRISPDAERVVLDRELTAYAATLDRAVR